MNSDALKRRQAERELVRNTDRSLKTMEESMKIYIASNESIRAYGTLPEKLGHSGLHHTIGLMDMMIYLEKIELAKRPYEKNLFGRLLAMHLCEFLDDMNQIIGTVILPDLDNAFLEEYMPVFKSINRAYSLLRKEHGAYLRSIRNHAAAHRTMDVPLLAELVTSVDVERVKAIAFQVAHISNTLNTSSLPMTEKMNKSAKFILEFLEMYVSGMSLEEIENKLQTQ